MLRREPTLDAETLSKRLGRADPYVVEREALANKDHSASTKPSHSRTSTPNSSITG
jgi:hypothetical protein